MPIKWASLGNGWISPHFREHEFVCPCCGKFIGNLRLLVALEELRVLGGDLPIHPTSGTRCPAWNAMKGGADNSKHISGEAADIVMQGLHPLEMVEYANSVEAFSHGGIGVYPHNGFIHVDVRTNGPARWTG